MAIDSSQVSFGQYKIRWYFVNLKQKYYVYTSVNTSSLFNHFNCISCILMLQCTHLADRCDALEKQLQEQKEAYGELYAQMSVALKDLQHSGYWVTTCYYYIGIRVIAHVEDYPTMHYFLEFPWTLGQWQSTIKYCIVGMMLTALSRFININEQN